MTGKNSDKSRKAQKFEEKMKRGVDKIVSQSIHKSKKPEKNEKVEKPKKNWEAKTRGKVKEERIFVKSRKGDTRDDQLKKKKLSSTSTFGKKSQSEEVRNIGMDDGEPESEEVFETYKKKKDTKKDTKLDTKLDAEIKAEEDGLFPRSFDDRKDELRPLISFRFPTSFNSLKEQVSNFKNLLMNCVIKLKNAAKQRKLDDMAILLIAVIVIIHSIPSRVNQKLLFFFFHQFLYRVLKTLFRFKSFSFGSSSNSEESETNIMMQEIIETTVSNGMTANMEVDDSALTIFVSVALVFICLCIVESFIPPAKRFISTISVPASIRPVLQNMFETLKTMFPVLHGASFYMGNESGGSGNSHFGTTLVKIVMTSFLMNVFTDERINAILQRFLQRGKEKVGEMSGRVQDFAKKQSQQQQQLFT